MLPALGTSREIFNLSDGFSADKGHLHLPNRKTLRHVRKIKHEINFTECKHFETVTFAFKRAGCRLNINESLS